MTDLWQFVLSHGPSSSECAIREASSYRCNLCALISRETQEARRRVVEAMSWSWSTTMTVLAPWKRGKNSVLWEMITYQYFYELTTVHLCVLLQTDLSIVRSVTSGVLKEKSYAACASGKKSRRLLPHNHG